MSPILQTLANGSAYGYRTLAGAAAVLAFESIATATGTGSSGTITFSSIPSSYKSLQIRVMALQTNGINDLRIRFNGDTGSNYAWHTLAGYNSSLTAGSGTSQSYMLACVESGARGALTATNPTVAITDVLDYADTNKNKTIRTLGGMENNSIGELDLNSGLWMSTSAVNSITIFMSGAGSFTTTSVISLYGIKGA
jgi:hypothetical protein